MAPEYILTPEMRIKLKKPIGILIRGSFAETMRAFKDMTEKEKPTVTISVGDTVSKNLVENHVFPQLSIVDNRVMRRSLQSVPPVTEKVIRIKNAPGTISQEAVRAVQDALKSSCCIKMIVDGEEDLLTLIAVLYAPDNSFVVYGQPYEGIVVVKATKEKKAEVAQILEAMESFRKAK
jgi:uncharacterized protein (UPF0218 family)